MSEPKNSSKILIELADQSPLQIINVLRLLDNAHVGYTLKEEEQKVTPSELVRKAEIKNQFREKELMILDLLSKGYKYNDMIEETGISIDGIRYYIKKIFKNLDVNNGRDAVRIYLTQIKPYVEDNYEAVVFNNA